MAIMASLKQFFRTFLVCRAWQHSSLQEQVAVVANLSPELLRHTLKHLVERSAARVLVMVVDVDDGYKARAWVEQEMKKYNTWLATQELELRGIDSSGQLVTKIDVLPFECIRHGTQPSAAAGSIRLQLQRLDVLIVGDMSEDSVYGPKPSPDIDERSSLLDNMDNDLEKAKVPNPGSQNDVLSTITSSLLHHCHIANISTGRQASLIALVDSDEGSRRWKQQQLVWTNAESVWSKSNSNYGLLPPATPRVSIVRANNWSLVGFLSCGRDEQERMARNLVKRISAHLC